MALFSSMRRVVFILICGLAGFGGPNPLFSQDTIFPAPQPAQSASPPSAAGSKKGGLPPPALVGSGTAQDYQKDNPLLKTDLNLVSNFQGKMFESKEFKLKQFGGSNTDQPIVLNKTFVQTSTLTSEKNDWQTKEAPSLKKSDLNGVQSSFIDNKRANLGGADVQLKMAKDLDGKVEDAKKAPGFGQMLSEGQKRYSGPESPDSQSEMELIQARLKSSDNPEDLKKNQLTTEEVKKLLQPNTAATRPK